MAVVLHGKSVNVGGSAVVPGLDQWISQLFDDEHLDTCAALAAASQVDVKPLPG